MPVKKTIGTQKKKLWKVFSQYIRLRDKGVCFTCGLERPWKQMQAGHFIPRAAGGLALYFDEQNVHCQCYRCNINLGGYGAEYARRLREKFGDDIVDDLYQKRNEIRKYTIEDYDNLIEVYKQKFKELDEAN